MQKALPFLGLAALIGACANGPMEPASLGDAEGVWVVTDSFGQIAPGQAAPAGQRLRLTAVEAQDLSGRICQDPLYRRGELSEATFLGLVDGAPPALGRAVPVLEVSCAGEPFGRYAYWKEGSLLAAEGKRIYRLAKWDGSTALPQPRVAETAAAPVPHQPSAEPSPTPPESSAKAPPPAHQARPSRDGGQRIYLASYRDEAGADRGWKQLVGRSPLLKDLEPAFRTVTLPGKGNFVRLYAEGAGSEQKREICGALARLLPDCGAIRPD